MRIKDTILNTKWKYMNKAFSPSNPVVDRCNNVGYKNIKDASEVSGCSIENIKVILVIRRDGFIYQTIHNS